MTDTPLLSLLVWLPIAGGIALLVMDAMGKDIILIETVGSGQVELDIFRAADTTLAVMTPGSGDDIQIMKAGILEVVELVYSNALTL